MPKKSSYDFDLVSESGNWNIAKSYTEDKISRPLQEYSRYITMANFGVVDVFQNYEMTDAMITFNRVHGLRHAHFRLWRTVNDTIFAIKKKQDKVKMKNFIEVLDSIRPYLNQIELTITNQRDKTKTVQIEEETFAGIVKLLEDINRDLMECLNNSDLIFTSVENMNPDELLKKIQQDIIHGG